MNDVDKAFTVRPLDPNNQYDENYTIPEIESGKLQYRAGGILNYLCWKGVIGAGNYLVQICW